MKCGTAVGGRRCDGVVELREVGVLAAGVVLVEMEGCFGGICGEGLLGRGLGSSELSESLEPTLGLTRGVFDVLAEGTVCAAVTERTGGDTLVGLVGELNVTGGANFFAAWIQNSSNRINPP